jgi:cobalamin biosynthesis protein CobT
MKTYRGVKVQLHGFSTSELEGGEHLASCLAALSQHTLARMLDITHSWSKSGAKRKISTFAKIIPRFSDRQPVLVVTEVI